MIACGYWRLAAADAGQASGRTRAGVFLYGQFQISVCRVWTGMKSTRVMAPPVAFSLAVGVIYNSGFSQRGWRGQPQPPCTQKATSFPSKAVRV